jgi:hypothetical protein
MATTPTTLADRLAALDAAVIRLAGAARATSDPDDVVTGDWSARLVVAHVVFWHEAFARNVADLAAGHRPSPISGTYAVLAERTRDELGDLPIEVLLERLVAAQAVIRRDIGAPGIDLIPYRRGSRAYPPAEHLEVTRDHVARHAAELEGAGSTRAKGPVIIGR